MGTKRWIDRRKGEKRIAITDHPYGQGSGVADTDDDGDYLTQCRGRAEAERLKDRILANWDAYEEARGHSDRWSVFEFIDILETEADANLQDVLHGRTL